MGWKGFSTPERTEKLPGRNLKPWISPFPCIIKRYAQNAVNAESFRRPGKELKYSENLKWEVIDECDE